MRSSSVGKSPRTRTKSSGGGGGGGNNNKTAGTAAPKKTVPCSPALPANASGRATTTGSKLRFNRTFNTTNGAGAGKARGAGAASRSGSASNKSKTAANNHHNNNTSHNSNASFASSAPPALPSSRRGLGSSRGVDRSANGSPPLTGRLGGSFSDTYYGANTALGGGTFGHDDAANGYGRSLNGTLGANNSSTTNNNNSSVTYVVGSAVVNPYVSVSPSVQEGLRERAPPAAAPSHTGVQLTTDRYGGTINAAELSRIALERSRGGGGGGKPRGNNSLVLGGSVNGGQHGGGGGGQRRSFTDPGDLLSPRESMMFGDSLAFFGDAGEMRSINMEAPLPPAGTDGAPPLIQVEALVRTHGGGGGGGAGEEAGGGSGRRRSSSLSSQQQQQQRHHHHHRDCMNDLYELYGTTRDDVMPNKESLELDVVGADDIFSGGGARASFLGGGGGGGSSGRRSGDKGGGSRRVSQAATAAEVLPQLAHAKERAMELVAVRKHIDWDVTIPTADTLPPPAISFLDGSGAAVRGVGRVSFVLDTNTLTLARDAADVAAATATATATSTTTTSGKDGSPTSAALAAPAGAAGGGGSQPASARGGGGGGSHNQSTTSAPGGSGESAGKLTAAAAAAAATIGAEVVAEGPRHRVRRLVGLLEGLAERVGLERVMEYAVTTSAADMFMSAPTVDADTGDLLLELNPSVQGTAHLTISGHDCGSVDRETGAVQASCNTLQCVVRVLQTAAAEGGGGDGGGVTSAFLTDDVPLPQQQQQQRMGRTQTLRGIVHSARGASASAGGGGGAFGSSAVSARPGSAKGLSDAARRATGQTGIAKEEGGSGGAGGGEAAFQFPAANPHELRYPNCVYSMRDMFVEALVREQQALKEAAAAEEAEAAEALAAATAASEAAESRRNSSNRKRGSDSDGGDNKAKEKQVEEADEKKSEDGSDTKGEEEAAPQEQEHTDNDGVEEEEEDEEEEGSVYEGVYKDGAALRRATTKLHYDAQPQVLATAIESAERELREDMSAGDASTFSGPLLVGTMQMPLGHLRLTAWQDRVTALLAADGELLPPSPAARERVRKEAMEELGAAVSLSLTAARKRGSVVSNQRTSVASISGAGAAAVNATGAKGSLSAAAAAASGSGTSGSGGGSGGGSGPRGGAGPNGAPVVMTGEKKLNAMHRLILTLLQEENRSSQQLFNDVVQLCQSYYAGSLVKTITVTGGTKEGLRIAAAAALSIAPEAQPFAVNSSPVDHDRSSSSATTAVPGGAVGITGSYAGQGKTTAAAAATAPLAASAAYAAKDVRALERLERALELCTVAMVEMGAYAEAQEYGVQRVHVLCLLHRDTTAAVCEAQRDLAEVFFFYGDYPNSLKVAADVLMLAEELYTAEAPPKLLEAQLLYVLASLACGGGDETGAALLERLRALVRGDNELMRAEELPRVLQAEVRLVLAYTCPSRDAQRPAGSGNASGGGGGNETCTGDDALELVHAAVALLQADEEEEDAARSVIGGGGGGGADSVEAAGGAAVSQRRLRWNLLSFAGALLMRHRDTTRGLEVQSGIVQDILTLGQRGGQESAHRSALAAVLWVGLIEWQMWAHPTEYAELLPLLRRMVLRVTQLHGPLHPLAACANLVLARALEHLPGPQTLTLAGRSLAALERSVGSRSRYLGLVSDLCARVYTAARRWRAALRHANAALVLAQLNHLPDESLCEKEQAFIGALLRLPSDVAVQLDTVQLLIALQERVANIERDYGAASLRLVNPLLNLADFYYLLRDYTAALACIDRALRVADPKGALFVCRDVLRPAALLQSATGGGGGGGAAADNAIQQYKSSNNNNRRSVAGSGAGKLRQQHQQQAAQRPPDVQARDRMVSGVLSSRNALVRIAQVLYAAAAVQEAAGQLAGAHEDYCRCLALLESAGLGQSLAAVRLYSALARLGCRRVGSASGGGGGGGKSAGARTDSDRIGDAYGWARRAWRAVHARYSRWAPEVRDAQLTLSVLEERLQQYEGTYIAVNPFCPFTGFTDLV